MPAPLRITLIEDDPDDIELLRYALNEYGGAYDLSAITRGDLAVEWAQNERSAPDLIIMDLNLPKVHGREVLTTIKSLQKFREVPLVVLTTSSLPEDKQYCLSKGANSFMTKPASPDGFRHLAETLFRIAGSTAA